jgi:cob(I)alamin adenosyltransferase
VKIYTRRGDSGETDLFGGARVPKDALRIEAYGAVDEANSAVGFCAATTAADDLRNALHAIQSQLFDLGAYLAAPDAANRAKSGTPETRSEDVDELESLINSLETELEPLSSFVLPGGTAAAAALHLARTACRRAERRMVALDRVEPLRPVALSYVNRLSDLLFVMARVENRRAGVADVPWRPGERGDRGDGG